MALEALVDRFGLQTEDREEVLASFVDAEGATKVEMCLQQRLQQLLVLKRNTSEITTTA